MLSAFLWQSSVSSDTWEGGSPLLFLFGLIVFLGSILFFIADLVRGMDVIRGLAVNAAGAGILIAWAAHDTLFDPNSEVATWGGAFGTGLLLYGLYLLLAGVVIGITAFWHARFSLAVWYVGFALAAIVVGFLIFPNDAIISDAETETEAASANDDGGSE